MENLDPSFAQSKYSTDSINNYFLGASFPTFISSSEDPPCFDAYIEAWEELLIIFPINFPLSTCQMCAQSLLGCHDLGV